MTLRIPFEFERETKRTYRFASEQFVGVLYVQKSAFRGSPPPETINVTIEFEE